MAGESDNLGDISIGVGGDLSPLEQALQEIGPVAEAAASSINQALSDTGGVDALTTSVTAAANEIGGEFSSSVARAADGLQRIPEASAAAATATTQQAEATQTLSQQLDTIIGSLAQMASALDAVAESEKRTSDATEQAASGIQRINDSIAAAKEVAEAFVAIGFAEKLGSLAAATVEAYGQQERLATSFQIMSGSAQTAADELKVIDDMSVRLGLDQEALEHSAQRLSVTFGVGEGLTGVMMAAANVSAVTGQSFDSVASSLERVQLTGQVSARQLTSLKLSWQDLATSMGVSITEAQALLKKGGQDAAADVQALLDAIKSKYGDAAATQAQGVLGQIRSLTSQLESLMEDAGKTIAAPISDIVNTIRTVFIPALKSFVETFDSLPGPVKEGAVVIGALAVALVPLAGILSAVGFAISGLETLATRIPDVFGRATISTEALAAADTHLSGASAGATAAMGAQEAAAAGLAGAETTAATALNGAAVAGEGAALSFASVGAAMGVVAGAAAAVGASLFLIHFTGLDEDLKQLVVELNGASSGLGEMKRALGEAVNEIGAAAPVLSGLRDAWATMSHAIGELGPAQWAAAITGLDQVKTGVILLTQSADILANHWGVMDDASKKLLGSLQAVPPALAGVGAESLAAGQKAQEYQDKVAKLRQEWNLALDTVHLLGQELKAGKDVQEALSLAQIAAQKAGAALTATVNEHTAAVKGQVQSLDDLAKKSADAASKVDSARAVYQQAVEAFKAGKVSQDTVNDAWTQLSKVAKDASISLDSVAHNIDALKTKVDAQITSLLSARDAYLQLKEQGDKTAAGQLAIAEALKNLETTAKNLGLTVDVTGGKLFDVADKAGKAAAGVKLLADQASVTIGPVEQLGVIVNGKFTPYLQNLSQAAIDAAQKTSGLVEVFKNVPGVAGDVAHSITVLRGATDDLTTSEAKAAATARDAALAHASILDPIRMGAQVLGDARSASDEYSSSVSDLASRIGALGDQLIYVDGVTETATDLARQLKEGLIGEAEAAEATAGAVKQLADAWDQEGAASSRASSSSRSGAGGAGRGGGAGTMSGESYLEDLISLASSPLSPVGGNFTGGQLDNMIQALKHALGIEETVNSNLNAGDIFSQLTGKNPNASSTTDAVNALTSATSTLTTTTGKATDSLGSLSSGVSNAVHDLGFAGDLVITAATDAANGLADAYTSADKSLVTAAGQTASGVAAALAPIASTSAAVTAAVQSIQAVAASVAVLGSQQVANTITGAGMNGLPPSNGLPPISITTNVSAGVVAGSNGMQQLASMIGDQVTTQLRQVAGLKL